MATPIDRVCGVYCQWYSMPCDRFNPGTGPDSSWVSPGTKKRKRVRSEYYEDAQGTQ